MLGVLQRVLRECTGVPPPVQCDRRTNREGAEPRLTALSTRQNSTLTAWAGFKWRMALFLPLPDFCTLPVYIRTLWNYSCCFLPSHIMSEQDGISTGRVKIYDIWYISWYHINQFHFPEAEWRAPWYIIYIIYIMILYETIIFSRGRARTMTTTATVQHKTQSRHSSG